MKFVRTDRELETPQADRDLAGRGRLVLLPDGVGEDRLAEPSADPHVPHAPLTVSHFPSISRGS